MEAEVEKGAVRISVDLTVCEANGLCAEMLPDIFHVGDDGKLRLLRDMAEEDKADLLREAEGLCPTQAIRIRSRD